jgi:histone-lysine N-methyltransferase SETD1
VNNSADAVLVEDAETEAVRVNQSGCARSEGFSKILQTEKYKYISPGLSKKLMELSISQMVKNQPQVKTSARENRLDHRRMTISNSIPSDILKFNSLKVRKKRLKCAKSSIHDWGLFALERIEKDDMVIEYIGEVIRQQVADCREKKYEKMGIGSSYLFRVDEDTIIDATFKGNLARFINHACDVSCCWYNLIFTYQPNCYARIITVEGHKKIVIYAKRDINVGEEITYDYKFPIEEQKIPCLCGSAKCRGSLN